MPTVIEPVPGLPVSAIIENIVTIIVTGAVTVGLYALGASGWSFVGLLILLNLNYIRRRAPAK